MRVTLDASLMQEKEETHEYLMEQFAFPDYYGHNLDAFYDCLTETDEYEVVLINTDQAGEYFPEILDVLMEAGLIFEEDY